MSNAKCYRLATDQLLAMTAAIDNQDRDAFIRAMQSQDPHNLIVGNAELTAAYVKVYSRALTTFISHQA